MTLWVTVTGALLLVVGTVAVGRTAAVLARHRADAAADLAALAAAGRIGVGGNPCAEARRLAELNSATMRKCRATLDSGGRSGTVEVEVTASVRLPFAGSRTVHASARAGRLPSAASTRSSRTTAPALSSGSLPLPHLGDCTHDGHPAGHSQAAMASRVACSQSVRAA